MVTAIVVAAGLGKRFQSRIPKPLVKIGRVPIIIYSLSLLNKLSCVKNIILVVNPGNSKGIAGKISEYHIHKVSRLVLGGKRRQDSVYNGLRTVDAPNGLILIHDAARPFIDRKTVSLVIAEAKKTGAAIVGVPVKATVKEVVSSEQLGVRVKKTLDRSYLWEIQTPQVFRKDLILEAYRKFGQCAVTDEAMLVEKLGAPVSVVMGSYTNIKITTPEDLKIAEGIAKMVTNSY